MKLLTEAMRRALPKLRSTESIPLEEKKIICKFFNPCGIGVWYVIEGQKEGDDFLFWGLVELFEQELGTFTLKELESVVLPFGAKIEFDSGFVGKRVKDVLKDS